MGRNKDKAPRSMIVDSAKPPQVGSVSAGDAT